MYKLPSCSSLSCNLFNVNWFLFFASPSPALSCCGLLRLLLLLEMLISKCSQRSERRPQRSGDSELECRLRARRLVVAVTIRVFCPSFIFLLPFAFCLLHEPFRCRLLFVVYLAVACYYYDVKNNKRGDSSNLKNHHHHHHNYRLPRQQTWPGNCCACCCCLVLTASQRGFGLGQEGEGYP